MNWQFPWAFYFLFFLIVFSIGIFLYIRWRNKWFNQFDSTFNDILFPNLQKKVVFFKMFLVGLAYISLVLALANPRLGLKKEKVETKGVELVVSLDVSESMNATDIQPSRLSHSKNVIKQLLKLMASHKIGLVIFSSRAYLQCPLTVDHSIINMLLDMITTKSVPIQGTSLREALLLPIQMLDDTNPATKVILLITDAEDHEGGIDEILPILKEKKINLILVGVGTPEGSPIPITINNKIVDFKRDKAGNVVTTKLNEETLMKIAQSLDAYYIRSTSPLATSLKLQEIIESFKKEKFEEFVYTTFYPYYHIFAALAFIIIALEFLLPDKKILIFTKNFMRPFK